MASSFLRLLYYGAVFLAILGPTRLKASSHEPSVRKRWLSDSPIAVPAEASVIGFRSILTIGQYNHLPLGIITSASNELFCNGEKHFSASRLRLDAFVKELNDAMPTYKASFVDDVVRIQPSQVSAGVNDLLNFKLRTFVTSPKTRASMVVTLWFWVRAATDPDLGSAYVGGTTNSETIPGLRMTNASVESILDALSREGHAGVWILRTGDLSRFVPSIPIPFSAYSYDGDADDILGLKCDGTV